MVDFLAWDKVDGACLEQTAKREQRNAEKWARGANALLRFFYFKISFSPKCWLSIRIVDQSSLWWCWKKNDQNLKKSKDKNRSLPIPIYRLVIQVQDGKNIEIKNYRWKNKKINKKWRSAFAPRAPTFLHFSVPLLQFALNKLVHFIPCEEKSTIPKNDGIAFRLESIHSVLNPFGLRMYECRFIPYALVHFHESSSN